MATSVYHINKGINKPIEFRGLKAQYISYLAIGLVVLLLLFIVLYLAGVHLVICMTTVFLSGGGLFTGVYYLNRIYGQHGLQKKVARYNIPATIRITSRKPFIHLIHTKKDHGRGN